MEIGITGGSGVLGSVLVKKFSETSYKINSFSGDIRNIDDIRQWINSNNFDAVIHLAAIVPPSEVEKNLLTAFDVNSVGTKNLVDVLNEKEDKPWLFYSSTSHVYKSSKKAISEEGEIEPISEYGLTKYAGEILAKKNYRNLCIGRIFSMYHRTQKPPFLYPSILKRFEMEDLSKEFELNGGESYRDFLNAEDIAEIVLKLMGKKAIGIYNIASGKGMKVKDFVKNMTDKKLKIKSVGNYDYLVGDINKLNKFLDGEK